MSEPVRLEALADVQVSAGPQQINHRERERAITIQITPPDSITLQEAIETLNGQIIQPLQDSGQLGAEYQINLSGTADKLLQTWDALKLNMLLAILITYLLMAALFESWVYPLVIILSVPMGAVGGIVGLKLLGFYLGWQGSQPQALDVLTMLGFVILVGTVVNNAILIVHQSLNFMREDSMELRPAILESIRTRIRPILMTTLTTVFGLSPLVFFPGAGSELYRGLGSVVLGGLLVSTVVTLFLVPTLFSLMVEGRDTLARLLSAGKRSTTTTPRTEAA
jgi:HAE1 family hydrophobic/amphiphilic exporter-1